MSDVIANRGSISGSIVSRGEVNGGEINNSGRSLHGGNVSRNAGGTYEYPVLRNKPQINGEELTGDKSSEELHIVACKTSAEWAELITLQSRVGEIYVYSDGGEDAEGNPIPAIKIGDGNAYVVDLPFATGVDMRITDEDIENWNNKVAVRIEGDRLIFY